MMASLSSAAAHAREAKIELFSLIMDPLGRYQPEAGLQLRHLTQARIMTVLL